MTRVRPFRRVLRRRPSQITGKPKRAAAQPVPKPLVIAGLDAWLAGFSKKVKLMPTRRIFLRNAGLAMVGVGTAPLWLERALYAANAPGSAQENSGGDFPARCGRRLEHRGAARRAALLRDAADHRRSAAFRRRSAEFRHRSRWLLRPASRARSVCSRSTRRSISPSCMQPARPIPRVRTSMRRTTWNPGTPGRKATG